METTSSRSRIQVSISTADELKKLGKARWLTPRDGTVSVKGKGEMQTYWLETKEESLKRAKLAKYKNSSKSSRKKGMNASIIGANGDPLPEMAPVQEDQTERDDDDEIWEEDDMSDDENNTKHRNMTKTQRLVEWNVEVLSYLLQQILVARQVDNTTAKTSQKRKSKRITSKKDLSELTKAENDMRGGNGMKEVGGSKATVLDEFKERITLPTVSDEELLQRKQYESSSITLGPAVTAQLRDLITNIAEMYRPNHFHNFNHAAHVTASVRKLLTRIVNASSSSATNPELRDTSGNSYGIVSSMLRGRTQNETLNTHRFATNAFPLIPIPSNLFTALSFQILQTSDPLTQFAVVFSAVIHDADHPGVPNAQLVKENTRTAQIYKQKSIAEQNSVDLVWELLMSPDYDDLRACIYSNTEELKRFRQLVVNTVMATDIVDKELQALRKSRWEKAFATTSSVMATAGENSNNSASDKLDMNRKATIVIEHLIQARYV